MRVYAYVTMCVFAFARVLTIDAGFATAIGSDLLLPLYLRVALLFVVAFAIAIDVACVRCLCVCSCSCYCR